MRSSWCPLIPATLKASRRNRATIAIHRMSMITTATILRASNRQAHSEQNPSHFLMRLRMRQASCRWLMGLLRLVLSQLIVRYPRR